MEMKVKLPPPSPDMENPFTTPDGELLPGIAPQEAKYATGVDTGKGRDVTVKWVRVHRRDIKQFVMNTLAEGNKVCLQVNDGRWHVKLLVGYTNRRKL